MSTITMQDILEDIENAIRVKVQKPKRYAVIFHNDDFTPMDFVVHVLERYFQKNADESMSIMLQVHNEGSAIVGLYSKELAEQKVFETMSSAEENEYPLTATYEQQDET